VLLGQIYLKILTYACIMCVGRSANSKYHGLPPLTQKPIKIIFFFSKNFTVDFSLKKFFLRKQIFNFVLGKITVNPLRKKRRIKKKHKSIFFLWKNNRKKIQYRENENCLIGTCARFRSADKNACPGGVYCKNKAFLKSRKKKCPRRFGEKNTPPGTVGKHQ
jgi:hypothetical protein